MPRRLLGKQKSYAPAEYRVKHRRDLIIPIYYSNPFNIKYFRPFRLFFVKNRECSPKGALSECSFQIGNEGSGLFAFQEKSPLSRAYFQRGRGEGTIHGRRSKGLDRIAARQG